VSREVKLAGIPITVYNYYSWISIDVFVAHFKSAIMTRAPYTVHIVSEKFLSPREENDAVKLFCHFVLIALTLKYDAPL
jgi:hypothetical protein